MNHNPAPPRAYQSIMLDSGLSPSGLFVFQFRMARMPMTALDRNLTPSQNFCVQGSGWRFDECKPA